MACDVGLKRASSSLASDDVVVNTHVKRHRSGGTSEPHHQVVGKEEDSEELPSVLGLEPIDHRQECRRVEDCCQGASAFDSASEVRSRRWLLAAIADQKCTLARLVRSRQLIRNHPTLPPDLHDFFAAYLVSSCEAKLKNLQDALAETKVTCADLGRASFASLGTRYPRLLAKPL